MRSFDGRTDGETDGFTITNTAVHTMQHGKNVTCVCFSIGLLMLYDDNLVVQPARYWEYVYLGASWYWRKMEQK